MMSGYSTRAFACRCKPQQALPRLLLPILVTLAGLPVVAGENCFEYLAHARWLSGVPTPGQREDVAIAVSGRHAYMADGSLRVIDISDPAVPRIVGEVGGAIDVAVLGNYAYVVGSGESGGQQVQVIDVGDPAAPRALGVVPCYYPRDVAVSGHFVYVTGDYKLQVIDVSDPAQPQTLGFLTGPGASSSLAVAGNHAYVTRGRSGLEVIDITVPTSPTVVGTVDTPHFAAGVAVSGDYAYVADTNAGLQIIDIQDPATPRIVGAVDTPGVAVSVAVLGNRAYVADDLSGLQVIEISEPASPRALGVVTLPPWGRDAQDVALAGDYAYVAAGYCGNVCGNAGFHVVDLSNPLPPPLIVGGVATPAAARSVAISGDLAYVADEVPWAGYFHVIDVHDPTSPRILAAVDTLDAARRLAVAGNHAYLAEGPSGLLVIDITHPAFPRIAGKVDTPGDAQGIAIADGHAYVADGFQGLQVIDIRDPTSPRILRTVPTPGSCAAAAVSGSYVYVADVFWGLQVIDVSDPFLPRVVGRANTPGDAGDIAVSRNYAYVADGVPGLQVIDISDPASPRLLAAVDTPGFAQGVAISGNHAYVADGFTGIQVIDISDPASPRLLGAAETPGSAQGIAVSGYQAFVADGYSGLQVVPRQCDDVPVVWPTLSCDSLPRITLGDTLVASLIVHNVGREPLVVSSIDPPFPTVSLMCTVPFTVDPLGMVDVGLVFAPDEEGFASGNLRVASNDPAYSISSVWLQAEVLGLGVTMNTIPPSPVPLGVEITVKALPRAGARIERATLFFTGRTIGFLSSAMQPSREGFLGKIPAQLNGEGILAYYVRTENSDFKLNSPPGAPDDSVATVIQSPTWMHAVEPDPADPGQDVTVQVALEPGTLFVQGNVHYRPGGGTNYSTVPLEFGPVFPVPQATIPGDKVDIRGLDYWVDVQTLTRTFTSPVDRPALFPYAHCVKVRALQEDRPHPGARYRMLSTPVNFGAAPPTLADVLVDQIEFGSYNATRWQAFRYSPESKVNIEFSPADTLFRLRPGRAFWLVNRENHKVDTAPYEGLSTRSGRDFPIVLAPGWNQFGNPFVFPIPWAAVARSDSEAIGDLTAYDDSIGDYGLSSPCLLTPFDGYFVRNTSNVPETLWVRPQHARSCTSAALASLAPGTLVTSANTESWMLRLQARTQDAGDRSNLAGVAAGTLEDRDPRDCAEPPLPPGPWVQLAFANWEWSHDPGLYRIDARPPDEDGHSWRIEIRSPSPVEEVVLELFAASPLPAGLAVNLLDLEIGSLYEIQPAASIDPGIGRLHRHGTRIVDDLLGGYPILSYGPDRPYRFLLLAGSRSFVSRESQEHTEIPHRTALDQNSPNPFNQSTRIRFGVSESQRVTLDIFDVRGKRIRTLLHDSSFVAGYHGVLWDGSDESGQSVASGSYLYRLRTNGAVLVKRLVLLK